MGYDANDVFIGRAREQEIFRAVLKSILAQGEPKDSDTGFLVLASGHGGIGKSTLLRRYAAISKGESPEDSRFRGKFLTVFIDWDTGEPGSIVPNLTNPTPERLMSRLANGFYSAVNDWREKRMVRKAFKDFYNELTVARRRSGVSDPNQAAGGISTRQASAAIAGDIAGAVVGLAGVAPLALPVTNAATLAFGKVGDVFDTRREVREMAAGGTDPLESCREALAAGIRKIARTRPVVIVLDTCELLGGAAWALRTLIQTCGLNVCWVIGIRLEPRESAADDSETIRYLQSVEPARCQLLELRGFDVEAIRSFISAHRLPGEADAAAIAGLKRVTHGIPLAVALAVRILKTGARLDDLISEASPSDDSAWIVRVLAERYLRHVTRVPALAADLPLLQGISLFPDMANDYRLLAALWGMPGSQVRARLRELALRHDFIFTGRLGSPQNVMHKDIRDTLRKHLREPDERISVREMNQNAISYLKEELRASGLTNIERQLNPDEQDEHASTWQANTAALLWHTFWVDAAEGVALIRRLYPAAVLLAPGFARAQAQIAGFQLGSSGLHARRLLSLIATGAGANFDELVPAEAFKDLGASPIADGPSASDIPHSVYYGLLCLNWCRAGIVRHSLAERTAQLVRVSGQLAARRDEQSGTASHTEAILVDEARELGFEASRTQQYETAVTSFGIAARWHPRDFKAHGNLALAYAALGRATEAAESFKSAIEVNPNDAAMHAAFGELMILAKSGDIHGRREALDWAIRKSPKEEVHPLVLRGLIPQALAPGEAAQEAERYFRRALSVESDEQDFQAHELRAIAEAGLGRTDAAVRELGRAIQYWTPANKYRVAIYDLLTKQNSAGAEALMKEWQDILSGHPEAALPWG
jgi:tetratricopeptide (TPR) repeat protein